jgi:hypothetical protein
VWEGGRGNPVPYPILSIVYIVQLGPDRDLAGSDLGTGNPSLRPKPAVVGPSARPSAVSASRGLMSMPAGADDTREPTAALMQSVSPRQALAASLLVSGKQGREVAVLIGVTSETISRWRHQSAFQSFMHQLLRQHIDSVQLGMIALTGEAITQLRYLVNGFTDEISLKACALVLAKAAPIITAIGAELRRSPAETDARP